MFLERRSAVSANCNAAKPCKLIWVTEVVSIFQADLLTSLITIQGYVRVGVTGPALEQLCQGAELSGHLGQRALLGLATGLAALRIKRIEPLIMRESITCLKMPCCQENTAEIKQYCSADQCVIRLRN